MSSTHSNVTEPLESRLLFTAIPFVVDRDPPVVTLADLNGDGKADQVSAKVITDRDTGRSKGFLSVELGNGDGTFRKRSDHRGSVDLTPDEFAAFCTGDLDRDGDIDICLAAREPQSGKATGLAMIPVDKDGALGELKYLDVVDPLGGKITVVDVAAGDVNGDGYCDVVEIVSPLASGKTSPEPGKRVLWGLGGNINLTKLPVSSPVIPLPPGTDCVFVGDVDGDGVAEAVATAKSFQPSPRSAATVPAVVTTDFSLEGEAKTARQTNPIYKGDTSVSNNPLYQARQTIGVGDVDGDGKADLLGEAGGTIRVATLLRNEGYGPARDMRGRCPAPSGTPIAAGDLDGDGRADFVVPSKIDGFYLAGFTSPTADGSGLQVDWKLFTPPPTLGADRPDNGGGPAGGVPAADDLLRLLQQLQAQSNGNAADALAIVLKQERFAAFFHS